MSSATILITTLKVKAIVLICFVLYLNMGRAGLEAQSHARQIGDQEVGGSISAGSGNIISWTLWNDF